MADRERVKSPSPSSLYLSQPRCLDKAPNSYRMAARDVLNTAVAGLRAAGSLTTSANAIREGWGTPLPGSRGRCQKGRAFADRAGVSTNTTDGQAVLTHLCLFLMRILVPVTWLVDVQNRDAWDDLKVELDPAEWK